MALFSIEHMFESRVDFRDVDNELESLTDSNHNGRVKRPQTQKAAQGNSTVTTANSNHPKSEDSHLWFRDARWRSLLNHREGRAADYRAAYGHWSRLPARFARCSTTGGSGCCSTRCGAALEVRPGCLSRWLGRLGLRRSPARGSCGRVPSTCRVATRTPARSDRSARSTYWSKLGVALPNVDHGSPPV